MRNFSILKLIDIVLFVDERVEPLPPPKSKPKKKKPPKMKRPKGNFVKDPNTGKLIAVNHDTEIDKNGKVIKDHGTKVEKGGNTKIKNEYHPLLTGYDIQEVADAKLKEEYSAALKAAMANGDTVKEMLLLKIGPVDKPFSESTIKSYRRAFRKALERQKEDATTPLSSKTTPTHV